MKRDRYDLYIRFLLLIVGMAFGFIGFLIFTNYTELGGVVVVVADLTFIIMMYFAIRRKYINELTYYLKELTEDIKKITNGEHSLYMTSSTLPEVVGLYESVEELRKNLKMQNKTKDTVLKIINTLALNIELGKLLDELIPKIIEGTKSNWGAFYLYNFTTGKLELKASIGFSKNIYNDFDISLGEGFVGKSSKANKIEIINDIPSDTVYITRTFLGKIKPRSMMSVPITSSGELVGTLLLASIYDYKEEQIDIIRMIRYYLGVAVTNGITYERTQRLKNELQFQNQLIQNLNEELEQKVQERTLFLNGIIDGLEDYAIVSIDNFDAIVTWNKGAEKVVGYTHEEAIGQNILELYEQKDDFINGYTRKLELAKNEGKFESRGWLIRKSGEKYYAEITILPMLNQNEEINGYTSIIVETPFSNNLV